MRRAELACPLCTGRLSGSGHELRCRGCPRVYSVVDGIPMLLPAEEGEPDPHKQRQVEFFDAEADEEWEVRRPHSTPAMYGWLMEEKFRRSVESLQGQLGGLTALVVCGGSGMDAEFLARAGADVTCSDLSLGAAQRARRRARTFGVDLDVLVADVEHLPLADLSFDLVYVHDGLHHLEDPYRGVAEMARVAKRAVSINEPAQAAGTAAAVVAGISANEEEAGNRVERMSADEIRRTLGEAGFRVLSARRYAMYYKHHPGPAMRAFSRPGLFELGRISLNAFNAILGGIGNKMSVQAVRDL